MCVCRGLACLLFVEKPPSEEEPRSTATRLYGMQSLKPRAMNLPDTSDRHWTASTTPDSQTAEVRQLAEKVADLERRVDGLKAEAEKGDAGGSEDWQFVARVLDRLSLIIFPLAIIVGMLAIVLDAFCHGMQLS